MYIRRGWRPLAAPLLLAVFAGCTTLTPADIGDFGAEKRLLVTLRDGETIKGHIDVGETVTFTTFGRVYRAEVESIDDNGNIVLASPYVREEYDQYAIQRERMEGSVLKVRDETERISVPAYKIVEVQEISIDKMKTARVSVFWAFTAFVAVQMFNARF